MVTVENHPTAVLGMVELDANTQTRSDDFRSNNTEL